MNFACRCQSVVDVFQDRQQFVIHLIALCVDAVLLPRATSTPCTVGVRRVGNVHDGHVTTGKSASVNAASTAAQPQPVAPSDPFSFVKTADATLMPPDYFGKKMYCYKLCG